MLRVYTYSRSYENSDISVLYHSVKTKYVPCRSMFSCSFARASNQLVRSRIDAFTLLVFELHWDTVLVVLFDFECNL